MNILIDDFSPQIEYYASATSASGWTTNHTSDALLSSYSKGTFHGTWGDGDRMVYRFNGSAVAIYGAKRENHGIYGVSLDGGDELMADGYSATSIFKQLLYTQGSLDDSEHTITVTNHPNSSTSAADGNHWLDIDYIETTSSVDGSIYTTIIDDSSSVIVYDGWETYLDSTNNVLFYNLTDHTTSTYGATMDIPFTGSSIQVMASVNSGHGNYSVSLDGGAASTYNATFDESAWQLPIFTATNLPDGNHTVRLTNLGSGSTNTLSFDYAVVNSTVSTDSSSTTDGLTQATTSANSTAPTTSTSATSISQSSSSGPAVAALVGGIVGGIVALVLIAGLAFCLFRRRRNSRRYGDDDAYYASAWSPWREKRRSSKGDTLDLGEHPDESMAGTPMGVRYGTPVTPFFHSHQNSHPQSHANFHPQSSTYANSHPHSPHQQYPAAPSSGSSGEAFYYPPDAPQAPSPSSVPHEHSPFLTQLPAPPASSATSYQHSAPSALPTSYAPSALPTSYAPSSASVISPDRGPSTRNVRTLPITPSRQSSADSGMTIAPDTPSTTLSEKSRRPLATAGANGGGLPRIDSLGSFGTLQEEASVSRLSGYGVNGHVHGFGLGHGGHEEDAGSLGMEELAPPDYTQATQPLPGQHERSV
ncbi:hypothetical protein L202_01041 [Cryptococcus amylolentus CBS 6039]|uniref:Uncharacterized protein n=1 Tax=Cryptococcus amylolentus CBS 6039 TaxID=1295533 RepID=A0A1E3I2E8_9TREE|nr:hypothetical protein L202_01041 [Cryptococcus amylolentus CBS 6039]ODN82762.1 hypothetical protein L202_01041 [Cryptococcus amylolentus CBS 6039]